MQQQQQQKKKKTRTKINVLTWTSTADGVLVRTDETFCSDWPDAGRSCPFFFFFFLKEWLASIFFPVEAENTNLRSVNSGTVALLWPPAEPPARLEAAQHDVGLVVLLGVSDRGDSCCGFNKKEQFDIFRGEKMLIFFLNTTVVSPNFRQESELTVFPKIDELSL